MVALGSVLLVIGLAVMVIEAHASTGGVLGLVGVMAAAAGIGVLLVGAAVPLVVAVAVAAVLAVIGTVATVLMSRAVMIARRRDVRTGPSVLIGAAATVRTWSDDEGQVAVEGTLWRAVTSRGWQGSGPVPGQKVVVTSLDGLTVSVRRPHPGR